MINRSFVRPLKVLQVFDREAVGMLPTLLEVAQRPGVGDAVQRELLDLLKMFGPEAEATARPALVKLPPALWDQDRIDSVLRSWDSAAGRPHESRFRAGYGRSREDRAGYGRFRE